MRSVAAFFLSICLTSAGAQQDTTGKYLPPAQLAATRSAMPEPEMADIFYRLDGDKLVLLSARPLLSTPAHMGSLSMA